MAWKKYEPHKSEYAKRIESLRDNIAKLRDVIVEADLSRLENQAAVMKAAAANRKKNGLDTKNTDATTTT